MAFAGSGVPCTPLSPTYQSSQLLTPRDLTRITIDDRKYGKYQSAVVQNMPSSGRMPGGVPIRYGEHPILLERNHPLRQFYTNTPLQLSAVRAHDQIVPKPLSSHAVVHKEIRLPFPAEHPYSSHRERFRVFPDTRRDDVYTPGEEEAREIPLCRVVDRAQFKGWRREEVTLHRPYTAHLTMGQMPPWQAAIALQKKHHRSPTYPFVLPLQSIGRPTTSALPPVTPRTREGLSELQRSIMRTSYQEHYFPEETSNTTNVLVVETPALLGHVQEEGGEEGGAAEGGEEEGGATEGGEGEQEKQMEVSEGNECAGKEGHGGETFDNVEKERTKGDILVVDEERDDGSGDKGKEGEGSRQGEPPGEVDGSLTQKGGEEVEREGQPCGASLVLPSIQASATPSALPPSQPLYQPPPTLPRNITSSRRYVELCERFSHSEAIRRYHNLYPDQLPDLREATDTGRRHVINGYHAYFYH